MRRVRQGRPESCRASAQPSQQCSTAAGLLAGGQQSQHINPRFWHPPYPASKPSTPTTHPTTHGHAPEKTVRSSSSPVCTDCSPWSSTLAGALAWPPPNTRGVPEAGVAPNSEVPVVAAGAAAAAPPAAALLPALKLKMLVVVAAALAAPKEKGAPPLLPAAGATVWVDGERRERLERLAAQEHQRAASKANAATIATAAHLFCCAHTAPLLTQGPKAARCVAKARAAKCQAPGSACKRAKAGSRRRRLVSGLVSCSLVLLRLCCGSRLLLLLLLRCSRRGLLRLLGRLLAGCSGRGLLRLRRRCLGLGGRGRRRGSCCPHTKQLDARKWVGSWSRRSGSGQLDAREWVGLGCAALCTAGAAPRLDDLALLDHILAGPRKIAGVHGLL